ncbi:MAG TPA: secretin N-terminal domain-containing protein [Steroidobacteraceae bacterium]|nr:secretin N-terminal domain-containing protein [Steroidobacteraceae bacterium]
MRNSWCRIAGPILVLILVAGCAAERLHHQGLNAMDKGEYENGLALLKEAAQADPHNMSYRFDYATRREAAVLGLLNLADSARGKNRLDIAADAYRRVLAIDPGNDRAQHGLAALEGDARHGELLAQANKDFDRKDYQAAEAKVRTVLHEDPGYAPAQELEARINATRAPISIAPHLKTRDNHRVTLQLRDAPTKMVFEVLSRETGINFILDKDVKGDTKTTIFVTDVAVEQAIDLVLEQNALARQILADNMVLIYPNIAAKQKDYEQQMVRTFYLTNSTPKDVESMLKTVLGAKTMFIDERTNVVVLRDTPDAVHMAEKLVAAIDVAEPEVMLEVEVLEVSRSHLMDLGIQYPGSVTFTAQPTGTGGLVLSDLKNLNSDTIGVSSLALTVNAMKQAGIANTLASPRIRVRNKEKAKVLIGSKEPVITNTTTPTAGGTAVVTGSVQYLDVGLQLEVQPTVYLDKDVSIKMQLEVSSILKQVQTASGTIAYEIGTRNANTFLRLKDGETQILAGLIQESDTRTANTIPGLGDIPILSHLFGTHHTDQQKDEIVLSITPRIIRMQPRASGDTTEFWYGTETRTRSVPFASTPDTAGGSGQAGSSAPASGAVPLTVPGAAGVPANGEGAGAAPATDPTGASTGAAAAASTAALAAAAATKTAATAQGPPITAPPATVTANRPGAGASALTLDGPSQARVGDQFQVSVRLATDQSITKLRSQLRYDASALQLVDASTGDMVPAAAGGPKVDTHMAGGAQLDIGTTAEEPVQGNGTLMVLTFKAVAPRPATRVQGMLNVLNSAGAAAGNSPAPPLDIAILPAQ